MSAEELPESVKQLLFERIHSHEELEVVVMLSREGTRFQTQADLAGALKIDATLVGDSLNALRNRDIVESLTENAATSWRIGPAYQSQLSQLVAAYDQHRLEIVMLMSAHAIERVRTGAMRTFADCFFLGKSAAMAEAVYFLCALTSVLCAAMLYRGYRTHRTMLLFWSSLCFAGLALNNILTFVDLVMIPSIDLGLWRSAIAIASMAVLIYGLLWEWK